MAKVTIATLLNFFFPGAGYLVLGHKMPLAVAWLLGVLGLTYVELSLQALDQRLWGIMFASVFVMNTAFAVDAWRVGSGQARGEA